MKEKACAEQLRSLSDRANPSQEHAQTLGKVKQAVQDLYFPGNLWHSCSSSCEHWSHGSILCQTLMNRSSVCLCRTFPSPPAVAALPHLTVKFPTHLLSFFSLLASGAGNANSRHSLQGKHSILRNADPRAPILPRFLLQSLS